MLPAQFADFSSLDPPPVRSPRKAGSFTPGPSAADLANNPFLADLLPAARGTPPRRASLLLGSVASPCSAPAWTDPWADQPAAGDDDDGDDNEDSD
jgi:hypothetical protein